MAVATPERSPTRRISAYIRSITLSSSGEAGLCVRAIKGYLSAGQLSPRAMTESAPATSASDNCSVPRTRRSEAASCGGRFDSAIKTSSDISHLRGMLEYSALASRQAASSRATASWRRVSELTRLTRLKATRRSTT